ncbi:hypothetical protein AAFF_G00064670 [Aldrovandia affinis]|uniref:Uncharacterized protein n=1 Tax=Aldrovandia affinis TaxID=143900 RepID=A0AAD7T3P6_9TELE|nr:hypothetical protein AAFF_G00064670 [Aldrovandia affinis]
MQPVRAQSARRGISSTPALAISRNRHRRVCRQAHAGNPTRRGRRSLPAAARFKNPRRAREAALRWLNYWRREVWGTRLNTLHGGQFFLSESPWDPEPPLQQRGQRCPRMTADTTDGPRGTLSRATVRVHL